MKVSLYIGWNSQQMVDMRTKKEYWGEMLLF